MRISKCNCVIGGVCAMFVSLLVLTSMPVTRAQEPDGNYGVGIPDVFVPKYLAFRNAQLASSTPDVMRIKLGFVKGLSRSFINMVGEAAIDLASGGVTVKLSGLTPLKTYTVWLVDKTDIDPPAIDATTGLVTFVASGSTALLTRVLPLLPLDFTIDRIVVTENAIFGEPLAAGMVNVVQKLFFRRLSLLNQSSGVLLHDETTTAPAFSSRVPATEFETTAGSSGRAAEMDKLISRGAQLFFEETFAGNGRTCGTCHPASNNFMIDPAFIQTLFENNPRDPLFVAEFNPALTGLERPELMKKFGLILENLDGLENPTVKFVMRGVPHTLGLQVSLEPDPTQQPTPAEMTGWSGDGAPGTGSLREFAIGAVRQHFPKRLNRVENVDFVLPTEKQLDAMEAFQLSLGRSADVDLTQITFNDSAVENGKDLFVDGTNDPAAGGKCAFCHNNGGALGALDSLNHNFNTNVEDVPHPARGIEDFPIDGGFGQTGQGDRFGNFAFNTASVVEAADTPPFFHNNVVATLEGVMDFYTGPQFNNPQRPPAAQFAFTQEQKDQIADFMRALNTLQNIDVAGRELQEILDHRTDPASEQKTRLQTALDDTEDAIAVLTQGGIFPVAVTRLTEARDLIRQAQNNPGARRTLVRQAIDKLVAARAVVVAS